MLVVYKLFST